MGKIISVILFSNMVSLTPDPIDVEVGEYTLVPKKPISAVTEGASLHLDVTAMVPSDKAGILDARRWVQETFGEGFVTAELRASSEDDSVNLSFRGNSSWSAGEVYLLLTSDDGVPTDQEFDRVLIKTNLDLYGIRIIWKNYSK